VPDDAARAPRVAEVTWLEPYPDLLLEGIADRQPGPEPRYEADEAIPLALITALQLLPPRQRAALILVGDLGSLRCLPGQDFHPQARTSLQDATRGQAMFSGAEGSTDWENGRCAVHDRAGARRPRCLWSRRPAGTPAADRPWVSSCGVTSACSRGPGRFPDHELRWEQLLTRRCVLHREPLNQHLRRQPTRFEGGPFDACEGGRQHLRELRGDH
jgi:hypothetical protein